MSPKRTESWKLKLPNSDNYTSYTLALPATLKTIGEVKEYRDANYPTSTIVCEAIEIWDEEDL